MRSDTIHVLRVNSNQGEAAVFRQYYNVQTSELCRFLDSHPARRLVLLGWQCLLPMYCYLRTYTSTCNMRCVRSRAVCGSVWGRERGIICVTAFPFSELTLQKCGTSAFLYKDDSVVYTATLSPLPFAVLLLLPLSFILTPSLSLSLFSSSSPPSFLSHSLSLLPSLPPLPLSSSSPSSSSLSQVTLSGCSDTATMWTQS